jgi:Multiubiquitin
MSHAGETVATRQGQHEVRVHIQEHAYRSPNPTTGEELYRLAKVPHGGRLYREVEGDAEDKLIHRNGDVVHLTEDEHFHFEVEEELNITIKVNMRKKVVHKRKLSFSEIVALAFDQVPTANFSVTYMHGPHGKEGSLLPGKHVRVKDGMIFNVTETGDS